MSTALKTLLLPALVLSSLAAFPAQAADMVRTYSPHRTEVTVRPPRQTYVRRTAYVRRSVHECGELRVDYRQRGYSENVVICQPLSAYNNVLND